MKDDIESRYIPRSGSGGSPWSREVRAVLFYLAIGILALVGAGAIIAWVRRGDEHVTFGVVLMVLALGFLGLTMLGWAFKSL